MPLSMVKSGTDVIITRILQSPELKTHLRALGIVKGTRLTVITSEFGGPMVIQARGIQMALGQEMLSGIMVETCSHFIQEVS